VELTADGDGGSSRIIISFKDIGQLQGHGTHLRGRGQRRPWDLVHMSGVEGLPMAAQPLRLWAGPTGVQGAAAPWLTGTFRVLAEGVVSTPLKTVGNQRAPKEP
jgi:hypothetical protein